MLERQRAYEKAATYRREHRARERKLLALVVKELTARAARQPKALFKRPASAPDLALPAPVGKRKRSSSPALEFRLTEHPSAPSKRKASSGPGPLAIVPIQSRQSTCNFRKPPASSSELSPVNPPAAALIRLRRASGSIEVPVSLPIQSRQSSSCMRKPAASQSELAPMDQPSPPKLLQNKPSRSAKSLATLPMKSTQSSSERQTFVQTTLKAAKLSLVTPVSAPNLPKAQNTQKAGGARSKIR